MKKLSVLLVVLVMLCMTVSAAAAEPNIAPTEADVTAKYACETEIPEVYSVDISWSNLTFAYSETVVKNWNADTHTYTEEAEGEWDKTTATVTVVNHSNAEIDVAVAYTPVADTGITGSFDKTAVTLAAGEEGKVNEAPRMEAVLTISGTPTDAVTEEGIKVGAITVTIS